jgi:hypothetical protein
MPRPRTKIVSTIAIALATIDKRNLPPDVIQDIKDAAAFIDELRKNLDGGGGVILHPVHTSREWTPFKA